MLNAGVVASDSFNIDVDGSETDEAGDVYWWRDMFKSFITTISTKFPSVEDHKEVDSLLIHFGNSFLNSIRLAIYTR